MRSTWALLVLLALNANLAAAKAADLVGQWVNRAEGVQAELKADGSAVVDGEPGTWKLKGKTFYFQGAEGPLTYSYGLEGGTLTLVDADGERLVYERVKKSKAAKAAKESKPAAAAQSGSQNRFLRGLLCSYSGGSTMSHSDRVSFDGQGRYRTGSESVYSASGNDQYGNEAWRGGGSLQGGGEGGTYEVRGEVVVLIGADGSRIEAKINMRQNDGRITELMYGKKLFAAGLCD